MEKEIDILAIFAIVAGIAGSLIALFVLYKQKRLKKHVEETTKLLDGRLSRTERSVKLLLNDGK